MNDIQFEIFMEKLIENSDFSSIKPDTMKNVYNKITAALSEEELSEDELSAAAGGLYNDEVNKFDDI
ncbi:MAG: hypothetical protein ACI4JN_03875 [Ruminococcus sp.]